MELFTPVHIAPLDTRITHYGTGLLLGSCFAENMAHKMSRGKLPVTKNPFGVLFNPASIASALADLAAGRLFTGDDLHRNDGLWVSFSHHGSFSSPDRDEALAAMNRSAAAGAEALRASSYAVITLGTAWIYERRPSGCVAANCHKFPAQDFTRRRMGIEEIAETLGSVMSEHLAGKRTILTVSPVRHLKDGLAENSRSKAILIEACHRIADSNPSAEYFPAYEIMNDELRDYRFYDRDMAHPSPVAVDYIWERFAEAAIDAPTRELMRRAGHIADAAAHRPLHAGSPSHLAFRRGMLAKALALQTEHPEIDLSAEINFFTDGEAQ